MELKHNPLIMLRAGKLKVQEKGWRAFPDRLGSLVACFDDNDEEIGGCVGALFETGEELETFQPNGFGIHRDISGYRDDFEQSERKPHKDLEVFVSVSDIIATDEKRSDVEYLLSKEEINLEKFQRIVSTGLPDGGGLRATAWKLLLGYLPSSRELWEKELTENRTKYAKLKEELLSSPTDAIFKEKDEAPSSLEQYADSDADGPLARLDISNKDHPLNVSKGSVWHQYFQFTEISEQIDRDLQRTHPNLDFFSGNSSLARKNREAMKNILLLFAKLNPEIRYVQGMNEVLAPLYYVFCNDSCEQNVANAEADSFSCFVRLLSGSVDHFCQQLDNSAGGIHSTLSRLSELLKAHDEELWQHLEIKNKVNPQFYAFRWITLLLTQEFSFPSILRIWDSLLSNPFGVQEMLLRVSCAMLLHMKSRLLNGDFVANLKLLQHYPSVDLEQLLHLAQDIGPGTTSFHMSL